MISGVPLVPVKMNFYHVVVAILVTCLQRSHIAQKNQGSLDATESEYPSPRVLRSLVRRMFVLALLTKCFTELSPEEPSTPHLSSFVLKWSSWAYKQNILACENGHKLM